MKSKANFNPYIDKIDLNFGVNFASKRVNFAIIKRESIFFIAEKHLSISVSLHPVLLNILSLILMEMNISRGLHCAIL